MILLLIAIIVFSSLLAFMTYKSGTQESISALAGNHRWTLLIALWSQIILLPLMLNVTPQSWQFIPFIGMGCIMICGGANVLQKEDEAIHVICAIISFICFLIWILLINYLCIVPVIICLIAGKDKLKWRIEIGLIISVYLVLLLSLY